MHICELFSLAVFDPNQFSPLWPLPNLRCNPAERIRVVISLRVQGFFGGRVRQVERIGNGTTGNLTIVHV